MVKGCPHRARVIGCLDLVFRFIVCLNMLLFLTTCVMSFNASPTKLLRLFGGVFLVDLTLTLRPRHTLCCSTNGAFDPVSSCIGPLQLWGLPSGMAPTRLPRLL